MPRERLTAFTDGVLAVIITIMVLELKPPGGFHLANLAEIAPTLLGYVLSFGYVAIYWNNHHHFFHLVERVNGTLLWANLNLLFWLSLVPFTTAWMGASHFAPEPTALYGASLLACALSWYLMQTLILQGQGPHSVLRRALGSDLKGKISPVLYLIGIGLSFAAPLAGAAVYFLVALMWLAPDRRIERALGEGGH